LTSIPSEFYLSGDTLVYIDRNHCLTGIELKKNRIYAQKKINKRYTNLFQFGHQIEVSSNEGVSCYNAKIEFISFLENIVKENILKAIPYQGKIYSLIYHNREIKLFRHSAPLIQEIYHQKQSSYVQGFFILDGIIWLLKRDGVIKMNLNGEQTEALLPNESASHILKDRRGYIWIATSNNGIFILPPINGNKEIPISLQTFQ